MITYDSITKVFGNGPQAVTALDHVSFEVPEGEIVVLLGPSGCGKTTTLRLTNRLEQLTHGTISVNGQDIMAMNPVKLRQSMGYVIQQIGLFPNKTIAQNVAQVPRMLGWEKDRIQQRIDELLRMVNLDPEIYRERFPAELSGGQQQRAGVARGLGADPEIVLMDEPFGAIDPINREQIQDEFLKVQARLKKTIVFVSHDIHEAVKMGDRIALFDEGRLIQYDSPEVLLTQPASKFVADFVGADRALKVLGLLRVRDAMRAQPANVVDGEEKAEAVLQKAGEKNWKRVIVTGDGKKVLGKVTRDDLKHESGPVRDLVQPLSTCVRKEKTLRETLSQMLMHEEVRLCVVDEEGRLDGTVSYQDIQQSILEVYRQDNGDDAG